MSGRAMIFIWIMAAVCRSAAHAAPTGLEMLIKNSPFNGPAPAPVAAPTDVPLEFRGVLVDGGEHFFSIYDATTRSSMWVGLKEPGNPFTIQSYDGAKAVALIEYKGRTLALALKQAKVGTLPQNAPAVAPSGTPPNAASAAPGNDANRLASVVEEIRRRQAARAQQTAPASAGSQPEARPSRN